MSAETAIVSSMVEVMMAMMENIHDHQGKDKLDLIVQCSKMFDEILNSTKNNVFNYQGVKNVVQNMLVELSNTIGLLESDDNNGQVLSDFLLKIIKADTYHILTKSISSVFYTMISLPDFEKPRFDIFILPLSIFINDNQSRQVFITNGALSFIWTAFINHPNDALPKCALNQIILDIEFDTIDTYKSVAPCIFEQLTKDLDSIEPPQLQIFITLIRSIILNFQGAFLEPFIQNGCYQALKEYIIKRQSADILEHITVEFTVQARSEMLVKMALAISNDPRTGSELKIITLHHLANFAKKMKNSGVSIDPKSISEIIEHLQIDNSGVTGAFLEFLSALYSVGFDFTQVLPKFYKFYIPDLMLSQNFDSLFSILKRSQDVAINSPELFNNLLSNLNPKQFAELSDKYDSIPMIILNSLEKITPETNLQIIINFSRSLSYSKKQRNAINSIVSILSEMCVINLLESLFKAFLAHPEPCSHFIDACTICSANSLQFRMEARNKHLPVIAFELNSKGMVAKKSVLNFVAAVSGRVYSEEFDKEVSPLILKSGATPEEIRDCASGILIGGDLSESILVLPSLIPFAAPMEIKNKRDLFLAAQQIDSFIEKTGKSINEFPSITRIGGSFIMPKHALMITEEPNILLESALNISNVSTFEFATYESNFTITHGTDIKAVSFWMSFDKPFTRPTTILTFGNITLIMLGNNILIGRQIVATLQPNQWTHFGVLIDENAGGIFVNGINAAKPKGILTDKTMFGDGTSAMQWRTGGYIRFFSTKPNFQKLVKNGVYDFSHQDDVFKIGPSMFLDENFRVVQPSNVKGNPQIAPSYTIFDFILGPYGGTGAIFENIIQDIANKDFAHISSLIGTLTLLQHRDLTGLSRDEYALRMSMLFSMCPDAFTDSLLEYIAGALVYGDKFDWSAFTYFCCDFSLLISPLATKLISMMFEYLSRFPLTDLGMNYYISSQMLYLAAIPDAEMNVRTSALELCKILTPASKYPSLLLSAYPNFSEKLGFTETFYEFDDSLIVKSYVNAFIASKSTQFNDYHILSLLPSHEAIEIMKWLLKKKVKVNYRYILRACLEHVEYPETWDVVLAIVTNGKYTDSTKEFSIDAIDPSLLPTLLEILTCLSMVVCYLPEDGFFSKLAQNFFNSMTTVASTIKDNLITPELIFFVQMMLSVGTPFNKESVFPPAPSLSDPNKIISIAQSKGSPFPEDPSVKEAVHPKSLYKPSISDASFVIKNIVPIIPERFFFGGESSISLVPLPSGMKPEELAEKNLKAQAKTIADTWPEAVAFMQSKFGIVNVSSDNIGKHPAAISIYKFTAELISKHPKFIEDILILPTIFDAKQSVLALTRVSLEILRRNPTMQLVDFICMRALEGWFANYTIHLIQHLFYAVKGTREKIPSSFIRYVLMTPELIKNEVINSLYEAFEANYNTLSSQSFASDVEATVLILYISITHKGRLPKGWPTFIKNFLKAAAKNDNVYQSFKRESIDLKASLKDISNGIFSSLIVDTIKHQAREIFLEVDALSSNILFEEIEKKELRTAEFNKQADALIQDHSRKLSISRACGATIREIARKLFLVFNCCFLRIRENAMCNSVRPFTKKGSRQSLTVLSDPLFPSRRLQETSLRYATPEFPDGGIDDIYPNAPVEIKHINGLPKCVNDCLFECCNIMPDLATHSVGSAHTMFALSANLDPWEHSVVLRLSLNGGRPFLSRANCKFLYGVEPIPGSIFLSEDSIYFIEGFMQCPGGLKWFHTDDYILTQRFYRDMMFSGNFGNCCTYQGHCMLRWSIDELLTAIEHYWLQQPYAISMTFLRGHTFSLILERQNFSILFPLIQKQVQENQESLPQLEPFIRSPVVSSKLASMKPVDVVSMWEKGQIDNYTFIAVMNYFGRRSYSDLTQYFIFPWTVSDYTSKNLESNQQVFRNLNLPMGQIGEERAPIFDRVYEDSDPHYHYGTHFMHFGVVLYFMFRLDPFCFFHVQLHKGWDHQNRLFTSIENCWESAAIKSQSDVKELIPQIYSVPECLTNISNLPLSENSDVEIPPWAKSPRDFTTTMTQMLDSKEVGASLNGWIDLIFGIKSRGKEAIEAKNVFHPLCYQREESVIEQEDSILKSANEACIINFGQCAHQILNKPCPPQRTPFGWCTVDNSSLSQEIRCLACHPTSLFVDDSTIQGVSGVSCHLLNGWFAVVRTAQLFFVSGSHEIAPAYPLIKKACSLSASVDGVFLGIDHTDGYTVLVRVYYNRKGEPVSVKRIGMYMTEMGMSSVAISSAHFVAATAVSHTITFYDIGLLTVVKEVQTKTHISCIAFDDAAALLFAAGNEKLLAFSVSGEKICETMVPSPVTKIAVPSIPESFKNRFVVTGHSDGSVCLWMPKFKGGQIDCILTTKPLGMPIMAIGINNKATRIVASSLKKAVAISCSCMKPLDKKFALSCAVCNSIINDKVDICPQCQRFVCTHCIGKCTH